MFTIEISNRQSLLDADVQRMRRTVAAVLEEEGIAAATINIAIVDDPTIHDLNRRFLSHDEPTDVLSFVLEEGRQRPDELVGGDPSGSESAGSESGGSESGGSESAGGESGGSDRLEGDVIASAETAIRLAARYDWPADDELLLYVVHGMLHLVGYDDRDPASRAEMRGREQHYLAELGLRPAYDAPERDVPANDAPTKDVPMAEAGEKILS